MRKTIFLILALALCLSIPVFADTTVTQPGDTSVPVTGTYQGSSTDSTVYKIELYWTDMNFIYTAASKGTWDPDTYKYTNATAEKWDKEGTIGIKNHSNTAITAKFNYTPVTGYESAKFVFAENNTTITQVTIASADKGTSTGSAESCTVIVKPEGSLPASTPANTPIGTITITLTDGSTAE